MNDMSTVPMDEVTIAGKSFFLRSPFSEGHPLTAGEAQQLNQVRHENVRNNCAKMVKEWTGDAAELNAKVDKYDAEYVFALREASEGRAPSDPITTEARQLARLAIKGALEAQGVKADGKQIAAAIEALLAHPEKGPEFKAEAERRVNDRKTAAAALLGGLNLASLAPPAAPPAAEAPAAA